MVREGMSCAEVALPFIDYDGEIDWRFHGAVERKIREILSEQPHHSGVSMSKVVNVAVQYNIDRWTRSHVEEMRPIRLTCKTEKGDTFTRHCELVVTL